MIDDIRARCKFNAALAALRKRVWLVYVQDVYDGAPFSTLGYNTLPSRLAAGIIQNQQIRKAAGMREF